MRILRIRLQNLNSLRGTSELDFTQPPFTHSGLFAITGDTGAGKSTLLDALTLALFGKTARKHENEVMSYGTSEAWAEVEFGAASGIFRSKWTQSRDKKGELKTPHREIAQLNPAGVFEILSNKKGELDGTKDEKGLVEQLCGLNFEQFRRSVMLAQGDFAAFLKADEKERSALLERLTDTEIYSRLSKAAFEKHKAEKLQLTDLQAERDRLRLLEPDELRALKAEKKLAEQLAISLADTSKHLREQLAWLQNLAALEQKRAELARAAEQTAADRTALSPALARLDRHRETAPFAAQVARMRDLLSDKSELESKQAETSQQLAENERLASNLEAQFAESQTALAAAETDFRALEVTLEKVIRLDEQIAGQQSVCAKLETELVDFQVKTSQLQQRQKEADSALKEAESQSLEAEAWLAAHPQAGQLAADLPAAEVLVGSLRDIFREQQAAAASLAELQKQHTELTRQRADIAEKTAQAAHALSTQKTDLQALFREHGLPTDDESAAETLLGQRTETAAADLQSLEDFARHQSQYRQAIGDLAAIKDEQANLLVEDFAVGKELLSALDLLEELKVKLAIKKERYEREVLIINYERERAALQPDEPCPLCGSTEHPFRVHGVAVFVDDARAEFEAVQEQLRRTQETQQKLAARHLQIRERIGSVEEELDELMTAQMRQLLERIAEQERSLAPLSGRWDALPGQSGAESPALLLRAEVARLRHAREQAGQLARQIRESERRLFEAETALGQHDFQVKKIDAEILGQEKALMGLTGKFAEDEQRLNAVLAKHGLRFEASGRFKEQFAELVLQRAQFVESESRRAQAQEKAQFARQQAQIFATQLSERTAETSRKIAQLEGEQTKLGNLQAVRRAEFGDKDPTTERAARLDTIEAMRLKTNDLRTEKENLRGLVAGGLASLSSTQKLLGETDSKIGELRRMIERSLARTGFDDVDAMLAAVLPTEEVTQIESDLAEIVRRETELALSRRETDAALAAESEREFVRRPTGEVQRELDEAAAQHNAALQKIGGIGAQLAANEALAQEARDLLVKIEAQKREVVRWAKMDSLIGSADGAKFRRFAQSLTLQQLILHANQHLDKLNGRYRIRRNSNKDLDLEIVDTYQADNVRGMNTLSGGETFLASLALALGLSDLAGRKTRIGSLFIDEGFGALDENALELAITTLENLQARGTTIGIISHIRELKERIAVQVQVTKGASGFSQVAVVG